MSVFIRQHLLLVGGHLCFFVLLVFAALFHLERTLYIDTAYQLFDLINTGDIHIPMSRYSVFLVKFPAWVALKCGASLSGILMSYSVGIVVVFYVVYIVCAHVFRQPVAALGILLTTVITVRWSWYHPMTETHQALVYCCLLWGWLFYEPTSGLPKAGVKWSLSAVFAALAFYAHPVAIFPLLFTIGFWATEKKQWRKIMPYALGTMLIGLALIKMALSGSGSYEGNYFSRSLTVFSHLPDVFDAFCWTIIVQNFGSLYCWPFTALLFLPVIFIFNRSWKRMAYTFAGILGMYLIVSVTFDGDDIIMMEKSLMPVGYFIFLPLLYECYLAGKQKKRILVSLAGLWMGVTVIVSLVLIAKHHTVMEKRFHYMDQLVEHVKDQPGRKFMLPEGHYPKYSVNIGWAYGFETLMYTSLKDKKEGRTFYITKADTSDYPWHRPDFFLAPVFSRVKRVHELNPDYFTLPVEPYTLITDTIGRPVR